MEKKRKIILISIGSIGISTGLLAIILMYRNYQNKKLLEAEAEEEQAEIENYDEYERPTEYLTPLKTMYSKASEKRFRVIGTHENGERDGRLRVSGRTTFRNYY